LVTSRSASSVAATNVGSSARLLVGLPSAALDVIVATLRSRLCAGRPALVATFSVNVAVPTANEAFEQLITPAAPTLGVVQLQPPGALSDVKVVPPGSGSVSSAFGAAFGPLLTTVSV